jgi:hypothetical protein
MAVALVLRWVSFGAQGSHLRRRDFKNEGLCTRVITILIIIAGALDAGALDAGALDAGALDAVVIAITIIVHARDESFYSFSMDFKYR